MFRKKQVQLTKAEALAHIPVKNPEVRESRQGGCVLLSYPLPVSPLVRGVATFFSRRPPAACQKKLELDAMGAHVWNSINGNRTVAQLADNFARKFGITHSEAESSVAVFLRDLGHRSLIAMR